MRIFAIADASKRKADPVALLLWVADPAREQGRFILELSPEPAEGELPLSLSFCASREGRRATPDESEAWVRSRIVPEDRHNIAEVLRANGLAHYDEVGLLAACMGRSSDDDYLAYEVPVPDDLAESLARRVEGDEPLGTDRLLGALQRQRAGSKVRYAFIGFPSEPADAHMTPCGPQPNAAARIGSQIRTHRKSAGLTQKQLAARAGITQTVLSRIESGTGNPTLSLLEDIAAALGGSLDISMA